MAQSQIRSWPPSRGSGMQSATWGHSLLPVTGKRTLPDQSSPLLLFQSQTKLSHPVHLTSSTDHLKKHQVRPAIPTPIAGHDCQDPGVRRPIGLSCAKLLSSDLMTWIFKISQISGQKDTATAKMHQGSKPSDSHVPKPGGPTLWQEAGHKCTTGPGKRELLSVPPVAPSRITHLSMQSRSRTLQ